MLTVYYSTATSGQLGLSSLHGGRGLLVYGFLVDSVGRVRFRDPLNTDFVFENPGTGLLSQSWDRGILIHDLDILTSPTSASWSLFYRLI